MKGFTRRGDTRTLLAQLLVELGLLFPRPVGLVDLKVLPRGVEEVPVGGGEPISDSPRDRRGLSSEAYLSQSVRAAPLT